MSEFKLAIEHFDRAYNAGRDRAFNEIENAIHEGPVEDVWSDSEDSELRDEAMRAFLFKITGYKLDPEDRDTESLITEFEEGYYDYWSEVA